MAAASGDFQNLVGVWTGSRNGKSFPHRPFRQSQLPLLVPSGWLSVDRTRMMVSQDGHPAPDIQNIDTSRPEMKVLVTCPASSNVKNASSPSGTTKVSEFVGSRCR